MATTRSQNPRAPVGTLCIYLSSPLVFEFSPVKCRSPKSRMADDFLNLRFSSSASVFSFSLFYQRGVETVRNQCTFEPSFLNRIEQSHCRNRPPAPLHLLSLREHWIAFSPHREHRYLSATTYFWDFQFSPLVRVVPPVFSPLLPRLFAVHQQVLQLSLFFPPPGVACQPPLTIPASFLSTSIWI